MVQNKTQSLDNGEVDFKKIIKVLLDSKKFIIVTSISITLIAFFYTLQKNPTYKSELLIEIGSYSNELIQVQKNLVSDLKINFIYKEKNNDKLKINKLGERLVIIEFNSDSAEKNTQLLKNIFNFVEKKHSDIVKRKIKLKTEIIDLDIKSLQSRAATKNNLLESLKQANIQTISSRVKDLSDEIPILSKKINLLEQLIVADEKNLSLIMTNPELLIERAAQSPILDSIILTYKLQIIDLEIQKIQISENINLLEHQLMHLENNIFKSEDLILLSNQINGLNTLIKEQEYQLELAKNQDLNKTMIIGEFENSIEPIMLRNILLGFVIGIIFSILIVLLRNFSKEMYENT